MSAMCFSKIFFYKVTFTVYIMVDSAMAASQNGFCSYKLSIHKKTNIMQIMAHYNFIYLIFYHREIVKLDHFMTLSLSSAITVL